MTALDNLAARQYVDARARWFSLPYVQVGGSLRRCLPALRSSDLPSSSLPRLPSSPAYPPAGWHAGPEGQYGLRRALRDVAL